MRFFDTHIHLSDFESGADTVIAEALAYKTYKMINVASSKNDWEKITKISDKYPKNIVPALGIHPWKAGDTIAADIENLERLIIKYPATLLGECGLDGLKPDFEKQVDIFLQQVQLAKKYKRPLIIHSVKSQTWFQNNWRNLPDKFVFHSYNGKTEFLKQIIQWGGYVGFNASVFKSSAAIEVLKYIPKDRILLETDAPYQGFVRGEMNGPQALPEIFSGIAEIRGENYEEFAMQIYENSEVFIK